MKGNCKKVVNKKNTIIGMVTKRKLEKDEELFFSYGIFYWITIEYGSDYYVQYPFIMNTFKEMYKQFPIIKNVWQDEL